jgi:hypothetical protein
MAYRTQSTRSQYRDVSPSEEDNSYARDITAAATAFLGGELISLGKRNAERKQINNALMLQSEANRVRLMTDVGKLATLENGVDKTQLKETSSAVIKDFSDAQLRVNRSTGTYVYTDPLTGQEMTREDDLKTISQASDYINSIGSDIEANEALIGKLQEQIAMNNIGNHPGGIDMNTVDPRILSIALGDDPSKGMSFTETYKVTYDKEKGYMTNVVYKGKAIKEANKALGVSGDEFTINTKSLAGILNDPERNPANMYAYLSSNNFVGEDKMFGKQASQLTDPKTGRLRDNFYTNVDSGKAINIGGNKMQIVDRDALKYDEVHSALNGSSVGAVGTTMRGNNPQQVITDIRAYTRYNEETKEYYYHEPVVKNGILQYNDKGEVDMQDDPTVLVKDGQLMVDQNDLDSKLTEMYTQFQLTEMGAYDKIKTTPIGNAYDASNLPKDPTRKQIATGTIEDFRRNVKLATEEGAFNPSTFDKTRVNNIAELISGVYGGGAALYDAKNKLFIVDKPVVYDEDGKVLTKGEKISFEYDTVDPNALDRLIQKLETSLTTTTDGTEKEIIIGKSSPEERRNDFENNFPVLKDDNGNMLEETKLVTELRKQFQDITFEEEEPGSDAISINGKLIKGSDYNTEKIMDVVYEQLNKSKAKEPKKETPEERVARILNQ